MDSNSSSKISSNELKETNSDTSMKNVLLEEKQKKVMDKLDKSQINCESKDRITHQSFPIIIVQKKHFWQMNEEDEGNDENNMAPPKFSQCIICFLSEIQTR